MIATADEERHAVVLSKVLERLRLKNIRLIAAKCHLAVIKSVEFLCHTVTSAGIDIQNVKKCKSFRSPESQELLSFLGLASYCRHIVPGFSIARPLYNLTSIKNPFQLGPRPQ